MSNIISINQNDSIDAILKPMTSNSMLYGTVGTALTTNQLGTAPIGVKWGVRNGDSLNTISMPLGAIQSAPTQTQMRNNTFTPAHFASSTKTSWSLQDYAIFSALTPDDIKALGYKYPTTLGFDTNAKSYSTAIIEMFKQVAKTDITRHAFWSDTAVNFATTYPTNKFAASEATTLTSLTLKDGFVKLIKAAVGTTGDAVRNYDTTGFNGNALTTAQVNTLLETVSGNAGYELYDDMINGDVSIEQKPVWLVSTSVYRAYNKFLQTLGDSTAYYFRGYDSEGRVLPTVRALQYEGCLMINASDVFDDWNKNMTITNNQHFAILTARDNLRIGYNFVENTDGFRLEEGGLQSAGSVRFGMFPSMDFKIASAIQSSMSVAGFQ
jgi:hypothetical protein